MSTDGKQGQAGSAAAAGRGELARLVEVLLEKRLELRQRVTAIRADIGQPLSADFAEQGVELENADVLNELGREAIEELGRINLALRRIDAGTYGVCEECGATIEAGRLAAVPWALRCVPCEKRALDAEAGRR